MNTVTMRVFSGLLAVLLVKQILADTCPYRLDVYTESDTWKNEDPVMRKCNGYTPEKVQEKTADYKKKYNFCLEMIFSSVPKDKIHSHLCNLLVKSLNTTTSPLQNMRKIYSCIINHLSNEEELDYFPDVMNCTKTCFLINNPGFQGDIMKKITELEAEASKIKTEIDEFTDKIETCMKAYAHLEDEDMKEKTQLLGPCKKEILKAPDDAGADTKWQTVLNTRDWDSFSEVHECTILNSTNGLAEREVLEATRDCIGKTLETMGNNLTKSGMRIEEFGDQYYISLTPKVWDEAILCKCNRRQMVILYDDLKEETIAACPNLFQANKMGYNHMARLGLMHLKSVAGFGKKGKQMRHLYNGIIQKINSCIVEKRKDSKLVKTIAQRRQKLAEKLKTVQNCIIEENNKVA